MVRIPRPVMRGGGEVIFGILLGSGGVRKGEEGRGGRGLCTRLKAREKLRGDHEGRLVYRPSRGRAVRRCETSCSSWGLVDAGVSGLFSRQTTWRARGERFVILLEKVFCRVEYW